MREWEKDGTGLFECLLTRGMQSALAGRLLTTQAADEDRDLLFALLYRHAATALRRAIGDALEKEEDKESVGKARAIVERVLGEIDRNPSGDSLFADPLSVLLAADRMNPSPGEPRWADAIRPETSFSQTTLLTGARGEPALLDELRRETETAESVDWLVSFVKMSGLRPMMPVLERFAERGGRLRVVTTTYVGATDPEAVLWLSSLPNAEIFVAYDTGATRHHAKSYLFHRSHGLSTAYAGSANLSKAALSYGLEWTVKVTEASDAALLERMKTIFDAYVTDAERFKRFDPVRDEAQLREAIQEARRGESGASLSSATPLSTFGIELEPYPFQKAILERLDAARTLHGETRSLVVAATGTGKTMIAAFDYRERARKLGRRENLLFVAHREEILLQARNAFRYVLNDMNFGELFTGRETPKEHRHVFLSVQTAASRDLAHFYPPDHFEYVVVDEFHHAAAQSYRALLDTLDPKVLLGLTATPWRGDGRDVLERFGGRITAELGLGDAIDRQLLVPFDYLMVTDPVSLAGLKWTRGSYAASELEDLYTEGGSARDRDRAVLGALRRYLPDLSDVRGIVFCAGRRHAAHVAKVLCEAGIPSAAIDGETPAEERRNAPRRLVSGELRFLCTVDVYNEGVDIPEVNTVLFLRPTESVTVFLQQLGRGLRKCADKVRLTVLDFVGTARKEFSFEARLRALTRSATANVVDLVRGTDSTLLPLGCTLTLEKQAMEDVLDNIKAHRRLKGRELEAAGEWLARQTGEPKFTDFLRSQNLRVKDWPFWVSGIEKGRDDLYFEDVLARAGGDRERAVSVPQTFRLTKTAFLRVCRKNGYASLADLLRDLREGAPFETFNARQRANWVLFTFAWIEAEVRKYGGNLPAAKAFYEALLENAGWRRAVTGLLEALLADVDFLSPPATVPDDVPLELHASYSAREALAAFGYEQAANFREGVLYLKDRRADLFFVTIDKEERHFALSRRYDDYAMNANHFHWQTQSTTRSESDKGRRYRAVDFRNGDAPQAHLFVREKKIEKGVTQAFVYLGRLAYVSDTGECPMSIVWELETPIPARWLDRFTR